MNKTHERAGIRRRGRRIAQGLAAIGLSVALLPASAYGATFSDVRSGDWFFGAVDYVSDLGIMTGYGGTTLFGPDDPLTRAQTAAVLYNLMGNGASAPTAGFYDVTDSAWYAPPVNWAGARGIMSGYGNGCFGTDAYLTREQLAAVMANACGADTSGASSAAFLSLSDNGSTSPWARQSVIWATDAGLINGVGSGSAKRLDPQGIVTRAQMAQVIKNARDRRLLDESRAPDPVPSEPSGPSEPSTPSTPTVASGLLGTWRGRLTSVANSPRCYGAEQPGFSPVLVIRSFDPTTRKMEATLTYCLHDHGKPANDTNQTSGDRMVTEDIVTTLRSDGSFSHTMTIWSGNRWNNSDGHVYLTGMVSNPEATHPSISLTLSTISPWHAYGGYDYYSNSDYFDLSKVS